MSDVEDEEDYSDPEVVDLDDFEPPGEEEGGEAPPPGEDGEEDGEEDAAESDGEGAVEEGRRQARRPPPAAAEKAPAEREAPAGDARPIFVVPPEERQTSNIMTLAETTMAIALRAQQISRHPTVFVDTAGLSDAKEIARRELYERRSPLVLRREVGRTSEGARVIERWPVREMTYRPVD